MNWEHIKADWMDTKGKVKAKWGKLTDDDMKLIEGKWDQLVAKLHERYGMKKDDAEREVDSFLKNMDEKTDHQRGVPPTRH
ncbi:MAG TPA: CsbD family protein [Polyangiaceae bacterium]|jgi:uncharacterized protein YjbJ (UPF0337 family)